MREIVVDGYSVTDEGNILSYVNIEQIKPIGTPQTNGMLRIDTRNPVSKKYGTSLVHRIIVAAFHPKFVDGTYDIRNKKIFVSHKNGDVLDNRYSNLNVEMKESNSQSKKWWVHDTLGKYRTLDEVLVVINVNKSLWYKDSTLRAGWRKEVLDVV